MVSKKKLFLVIEFAGFIGILSLLAITPPLPPGVELKISLTTLKLLSLIQPFILLTIATLIGVNLAEKVHLKAPVFEAIAVGHSPFSVLKSQLIPGLIGGFIGGVSLPLILKLWSPFLPNIFTINPGKFSVNLSFLTRILYGGITEEILLRWGLMTFLVWIAWRFFQKRPETPHLFSVWFAIILSALLFGVGHLPIAFALAKPMTLAILTYIITANSLFGLIAGYLYWKKGLESAMIAHAFTHVIMILIGFLTSG